MLVNDLNLKDNINELYVNLKNKIYIEQIRNVSILKSSEKILKLTKTYECENENIVCNILKKLNNIVSLNKENISCLENVFCCLVTLLDRYGNSSDSQMDFLVKKFNLIYSSFDKIYDKNSDEIDLFFEDFISYCGIDKLDNFKNSESQDLDIEDISTSQKQRKRKKSGKRLKTNESSVDVSNLKDNRVLLISQKQNKVFLPYYVSDLEDEIEFTHKYSSIADLIENEYIVPYSYYSNAVIARFNETYKLLRSKEGLSVLKSLNKGFKLAFEYNLNPAVISACRDLHELDSYLNCLYTNTLTSFKIFDIQFEINPDNKREKVK